MSNDRKMCLIKDLKPYRDEWRLTLKLLHSWKQSTSFSGDTLECVLVDQTVRYVCADFKYKYINSQLILNHIILCFLKRELKSKHHARDRK